MRAVRVLLVTLSCSKIYLTIDDVTFKIHRNHKYMLSRLESQFLAVATSTLLIDLTCRVVISQFNGFLLIPRTDLE